MKADASSSGSATMTRRFGVQREIILPVLAGGQDGQDDYLEFGNSFLSPLDGK